jgi:mannosyl-oligosaccharide alpha-1,2-mannosidase
MVSSDDELEEQLELLPTQSTTWKPNKYMGLSSRRHAFHYGLALLFGTLGITVIGYLCWLRIPPTRPPTNSMTGIAPLRNNSIWPLRAASVKEAFQHAYGGYEKYTTFPDDELRPVSNSSERK